jgi:predicted DNA-binding protein with PD1-like motif
VAFHPGAPIDERITAHAAGRAVQYRVWLGPGKSLYRAIVDTFRDLGQDHASIQVFDGDLSEAHYQTAPPDPSGKLISAYSAPVFIPGGARIVMANGDLGKDLENRPIVHLHAVLLGADGKLLGGHIPTDMCVVGEGGILAWALVTDDNGFAVRMDSETLFPLLCPN